MHAPTLTGEMLALRPLRDGDAAGLAEMLPSATGGPPRLPSWARLAVEADREDGVVLAICLVDQDECLGVVELADLDRVTGSATLHLTMRPAYRARGYGTEAVTLVLDHAFGPLGLHRVQAEVPDAGSRVRSVYQNLGFVVEGRRRQAYRDGEVWRDVVVLGMLADEHTGGTLP